MGPGNHKTPSFTVLALLNSAVKSHSVLDGPNQVSSIKFQENNRAGSGTIFQLMGWRQTYSLANETDLRGSPMIVNIATFQAHGVRSHGTDGGASPAFRRAKKDHLLICGKIGCLRF